MPKSRASRRTSSWSSHLLYGFRLSPGTSRREVPGLFLASSLGAPQSHAPEYRASGLLPSVLRLGSPQLSLALPGTPRHSPLSLALLASALSGYRCTLFFLFAPVPAPAFQSLHLLFNLAPYPSFALVMPPLPRSCLSSCLRAPHLSSSHACPHLRARLTLVSTLVSTLPLPLRLSLPLPLLPLLARPCLCFSPCLPFLPLFSLSGVRTIVFLNF